MKYCDLTLAYTPTSGGIRTYIDAKRRYLQEHTEHEHVLIIPGEKDGTERHERFTIQTLAAPFIPGCAPYRFFWHPMRILEALMEAKPDVVELGTFFVCPWAAFQYRKRRLEEGARCLVSGYFHTDLADAYFGSPLRDVLHDHLSQSSELLGRWGLSLTSLADAAEFRAQKYFGSIFNRCDLVLAASPKQIERLREYEVEGAKLVPLGVDIDFFHPERRRQEVRARLGAGPETVLIIYGGRLDAEKHVETIVDAFAQLQLPDARLLVTGEGALRKKLEERAETLPGFLVRPYATSREEFANLLASADIYVTAGPHETFGLSVVEAQASGLPVVGVNAGALRERVVPGTGALVPVDDATAMARALERVAQDRDAMGHRARQHVIEAGLDWNGTFRALFAAYAEVWERASRENELMAADRLLIRRVLSDLAATPIGRGEVEAKTLFDDESGNYAVLTVGWERNGERAHACLVHLELRDGKIWVQRDGTEDGIAKTLREAGLPPERMVLGFRRHS